VAAAQEMISQIPACGLSHPKGFPEQVACDLLLVTVPPGREHPSTCSLSVVGIADGTSRLLAGVAMTSRPRRTLAPLAGPRQLTLPTFKNSLRSWQAQYKAQQAGHAPGSDEHRGPFHARAAAKE
jgi:hypothetical protein